MKRIKTPFRQAAGDARRRLISGFWNLPHTKAALENLNNPNSVEEQLYRRVAAILDAGGANPLGEILDQNHMANLDDRARERYVLSTAAAVNKSIERWHRANRVAG